MRRKKIDPSVYVEAAGLLVAEHLFSCCTIDREMRNRTGKYVPETPERRFYQAVMFGGSGSVIEYYFENDAPEWDIPGSFQQLRVLLLCMMAACCKDFKELAPR